MRLPPACQAPLRHHPELFPSHPRSGTRETGARIRSQKSEHRPRSAYFTFRIKQGTEPPRERETPTYSFASLGFGVMRQYRLDDALAYALDLLLVV